METELTAAAARDREPDLDLIKSKMETAFSTLGAKAEAAALSSYDANLDNLILDFAQGDVSYMRELTQGKSFADKMNIANSLAYAMGQRDGPGEDMVVETKAERAAAIQAAVNAAKAASPARGTSVGGNPTQAIPPRYTTQEGARILHSLPEGDPRKISNAEMRQIQASPAWHTLPRI